MATHPIVIVGGGLAGATAAETLRAEGFDGALTLIGAEGHHPYLRPPLSKDYLLKSDPGALTILAEEWYAGHNVDLMLGTEVTGIEPEAARLHLATGRSLDYDRLLLATGASSRRLPIPGTGLDGVHYLRTREDSEGLHAALAGGGHNLVIIGSGWIGMEVAAVARTLDNEVTVLGLEDLPLSVVLGAKLGAVFGQLHTEHGVQFRLPASAAEITGRDNRVAGVLDDRGETIPADMVLIAVGAVPNTGLAVGAGLAVENGILASASLQTSDAKIYVAGDVANAYHPGLGARLRSEHWANAIAGGKTAARAMLGRDAAHDEIPYFYTDQYDLGMEYSGYAPLAAAAEVVIRGSASEREFIAFWVLENRVVAGMNVNIWDVQEDIKDLIRSGRSVNTQRLEDPGVDLAQV